MTKRSVNEARRWENTDCQHNKSYVCQMDSSKFYFSPSFLEDLLNNVSVQVLSYNCLSVSVAIGVKEAGILSQLKNSRYETFSRIRITEKFLLYGLSPPTYLPAFTESEYTYTSDLHLNLVPAHDK